MKKLLFSTVIAGLSLVGFAQNPTMDFETWTGSGTGIAPSGWVSENAAILPPIYNNPQSVFQAPAPDNHGGTYGLKILSVAMTTNPAPGKLPDPIGLCATGKVNLSPPSLLFGFGSTARPVSVDFWYKYTPAAGGDVAGFFVALTAWNTATGKRDTIANALWTTNVAAASYTSQSVILNYYSTTAFPDSMALIFSSTNLFNPNFTLCMNCGKPGSSLWVDDVTLVGSNGINEHLTSDGVRLFPNPASDIVNISVDTKDAASVLIYDAAGRKVTSSNVWEPMNAVDMRSGTINTSNFAAGLYSYSVLDKNGAAIRAGKFNVVR